MVQINICINSTKFFSEKTIPVLLNSLLDSGIDPENIFVGTSRVRKAARRLPDLP